jgi:hypothetical protein
MNAVAAVSPLFILVFAVVIMSDFGYLAVLPASLVRDPVVAVSPLIRVLDTLRIILTKGGAVAGVVLAYRKVPRAALLIAYSYTPRIIYLRPAQIPRWPAGC